MTYIEEVRFYAPMKNWKDTLVVNGVRIQVHGVNVGVTPEGGMFVLSGKRIDKKTGEVSRYNAGERWAEDLVDSSVDDTEPSGPLLALNDIRYFNFYSALPPDMVTEIRDIATKLHRVLISS